MSQQDDPGPSIVIDDRQTTPVDGDAIVAAARAFRRILGIDDDAQLSIGLVTEEEIASLAQQASGDHHVTDVLSFGVDDLRAPAPGPVMMGDLVICPAFAARNAAHLGRALDDELRRLVVHGILHLAGMDHGTPAEEIAMARAERVLIGATS